MTHSADLPPLFYCIMPSPVGDLKLIAHQHALVAVLWQNEKPNRLLLRALPSLTNMPILWNAQQQLEQYFQGKRLKFELPLQMYGTAFEQIVWRELQHISFGASSSYGVLAKIIGKPTASRAVGAAVGRNPLSIIIPCHRILGSQGHLTGFAGGIDNKKWLLNHECIAYRAHDENKPRTHLKSE